MNQLSVQYPGELPDVLQESKEEFENEARMAMAVKLFERRRISSGTAASMAGLDRVSFLLKLEDYGVAMIDLSADELAQDIANA